uniref:IBR domain-containing protein n=1 Tax=Meloidogyne hapla TaxID=6305 RepID=A0A1I8C2Y8_MELHA
MLQTSKRTQNIVEYCIPFVRRTDVFRIFEPLRASTWQSEEQTYYGTPLYFTALAKNHLIEWIRQERFECLVCSDHFPINRIVFCTITNNENEINEKLENEPGPSRRIYEELKKNEEKSDHQVHAFCHECILGQASAAVGEIPIAKGGIGLRCMMTDCDNPILYSEIRNLLSIDLQLKLEERMLEESIGMASIDLERCKKCNFAIEMAVDKRTNMVFFCPYCASEFCRLCERDWNDEHFGVSCEELDEKDKKEKKDKRDREIEKKLNEAVVRKCPRCGIAFMKEAGCNKMTCRCGMVQCYICRESEIGHDHFTKNKCLLFEDANKKDEQLIKEIREREEAEVKT